MPEMRDRRLFDPDTDRPFEHEHDGAWVRMQLIASGDVVRAGSVRRQAVYACPSCGYELSESMPIEAHARPA